MINRVPILEIVLRDAQITVQDLALLVRKETFSLAHVVSEMAISVAKKVVMIVRAVLKAVRKADQKPVLHVLKVAMIVNKSVVRASANAPN